MSFVEKVKTFVSGKDALERKQEAAANKVIRQKVLAAELKERERQSIRIAQETVRVKAERRLKQIRRPVGFGGFGAVASEYKTYGSPFGQPRFVREQKVRVIVKGKGKKRKVKNRVVRSAPSYNIRQAISPGRYDVLGL